MPSHTPFLTAILQSPNDPIPRRTYVNYLQLLGGPDKRQAERARLLCAWPNGPCGSDRYYNAEYLFGDLGEETGFQPGDPIPQCWPDTPFINKTFGDSLDPWCCFFYCLLIGSHEDAQEWIADIQD